MFTLAAIEDLVRNGAISVAYRWDPAGQPPDEQEYPLVDPDQPTRAATRAFERAYFGDRLGLTLGPLVFSHSPLHNGKGRVQWRGFESVYDLRESSGSINLQPGESVTVNTIENVGVDGAHAALILPRLTHATAGLILTPSYIDPCWQGLLSLNLVNISRRPYTLRFGERIAICRFYQIVGEPLGDEFRRQFAEKSHHYGISWERIESSDADPFPFRKRHTGRIPFPDRALKVASSGWGKLAAAGVTAVVVAGLLFGAGKEAAKLDRVSQVDQREQALARTVAVLSGARWRGGEVEIRIASRSGSGVREIPIGSVPSGAVAFAELSSGVPNMTASAALRPNSSGKGVILVLRVRRTASGPSEIVVVNWLVA